MRRVAAMPELRAAQTVAEHLVATDAVGGRGWTLGPLGVGAERMVRGVLRPPHGSASGALLLSLAPAGASAASTALERAARSLEQLASLQLDAPLRELLPVPPIRHGTLEGWTWLVQRQLPGTSGERIATHGTPAARDRLLASSAEAIGRLHAATAVPLGTDLASDAWVWARVRRIAQLEPSLERSLSAVADRAAAGLAGRGPAGAWVHGDLWSANVLLGMGGDVVSGLVDWESAGVGEHPCQDGVHLVLMTRRQAAGGSYGDQVRRALAEPDWSSAEASVLARAGLELTTAEARGIPVSLPGDPIPAESGILIAWLRQVVENVARRPALAQDRGWVEANIAEVARWA